MALKAFKELRFREICFHNSSDFKCRCDKKYLKADRCQSAWVVRFDAETRLILTKRREEGVKNEDIQKW